MFHCLHPTETSCLLLYFRHPLHLPGISNWVGQCAKPQIPVTAGAFLFLIPRYWPIICWARAVLYSSCVLFRSFPVLVKSMVWWLLHTYEAVTYIETKPVQVFVPFFSFSAGGVLHSFLVRQVNTKHKFVVKFRCDRSRYILSGAIFLPPLNDSLLCWIAVGTQISHHFFHLSMLLQPNFLFALWWSLPFS